MCGVQVVEEEWTANHAKLLYLISKFAVSARTAQDQESWIRSLPLIILMYEGIVSGCFDLDYAPTSTLISMVRSP
jgi:WD repeat-containing protein 35